MSKACGKFTSSLHGKCRTCGKPWSQHTFTPYDVSPAGSGPLTISAGQPGEANRALDAFTTIKIVVSPTVLRYLNTPCAACHLSRHAHIDSMVACPGFIEPSPSAR